MYKTIIITIKAKQMICSIMTPIAFATQTAKPKYGSMPYLGFLPFYHKVSDNNRCYPSCLFYYITPYNACQLAAAVFRYGRLAVAQHLKFKSRNICCVTAAVIRYVYNAIKFYLCTVNHDPFKL